MITNNTLPYQQRAAYRPTNVIAVITRFPSNMTDTLKESLSCIFRQSPDSITGLQSGFILNETEGGVIDIEYLRSEKIEFVFTELEDLNVGRCIEDVVVNFVIGKTKEELIEDGLDILYFEPDMDCKRVMNAWLQKGAYPSTNGCVKHGRRLDAFHDVVRRRVEIVGQLHVGADIIAVAQAELDRLNRDALDISPSQAEQMHVVADNIAMAQAELDRLNRKEIEITNAKQPNEGCGLELAVIKELMQRDPDYAWSWHCNIAMAYVDAGGDHTTGNVGAARFMHNLFGIDTSKFNEFRIDPAAPTLRSMTENRDQVYGERNYLVATLARQFPSGIRNTEIEGWDPEWHGCVFIDLPSGQISYHYHDSEHWMFQDLPPYEKPYDGHDKDTVHRRLREVFDIYNPHQVNKNAG